MSERNARAFAAVTLALSVGVGCSPDAVPSDAGTDSCISNGGVAYMGSGTDGTLNTFQRLVGNDNVYLNVGTQGLQHIWIGVRASGINPMLPRVQLQAIRVSDGVVIGLIRVRLPMSAAPENLALYGLPSQQLIIDDEYYCSVLPGDVHVVMDFDDEEGHCVHQETDVHVTGINPSTPAPVALAEMNCCTMHNIRCFPDGGVSMPAAMDASSSGG